METVSEEDSDRMCVVNYVTVYSYCGWVCEYADLGGVRGGEEKGEG